jgi:hypothetical protein
MTCARLGRSLARLALPGVCLALPGTPFPPRYAFPSQGRLSLPGTPFPPRDASPTRMPSYGVCAGTRGSAGASPASPSRACASARANRGGLIQRMVLSFNDGRPDQMVPWRPVRGSRLGRSLALPGARRPPGGASPSRGRVAVPGARRRPGGASPSRERGTLPYAEVRQAVTARRPSARRGRAGLPRRR